MFDNLIQSYIVYITSSLPGRYHTYIGPRTNFSLLRCVSTPPAVQAGDCVRRLASELEGLKDNAAAFGAEKTGLAGRYVLPCTEASTYVFFASCVLS